MKPKTVADVMNGLNPQDARLEFWDWIDTLVRQCHYEEALDKVIANKRDLDYKDQLSIVLYTIGLHIDDKYLEVFEYKNTTYDDYDVSGVLPHVDKVKTMTTAYRGTSGQVTNVAIEFSHQDTDIKAAIKVVLASVAHAL